MPSQTLMVRNHRNSEQLSTETSSKPGVLRAPIATAGAKRVGAVHRLPPVIAQTLTTYTLAQS